MVEIPGYGIRRVIGHGGMATVYLAVQESLGRDVALKVLLPHLAQDPVSTERFLRGEARLAQLHHPNIVAVHDVGIHDGAPYMSMGYEAGGTLAGCAEARGNPELALRMLRDVASALEYAHARGVVHRDVKPENILRRDDGSCVLSDFGIAHALAAQTGLTGEGTSVGTPHYMSPEQLRGEKVDGRADLYSLGVVFYQLLTGSLPFQGTDGWAIGMQHLQAPIPRLPPEHARFQPLLDSLLAKDPADRPQDASTLIQAIDALASGRTVVVPSDSRTDLGQQRARPVNLKVLVPIALIAVASLMFVQDRLRHRRDTAAAAASAAVAAVPTPARVPQASIAALPFVDLSEAKDQAYFSEGLSEELINKLAQMPGLQVAGRTSAFSFKDRNLDMKAIGRRLGVAHLLEGSVRTNGERVRITAQLVKANDGFHLWSQSYDRELTDVYAVQEEIASAVAEALKLKLLARAVPGAQREVKPAAYTAYLRARQLRGGGAEGAKEAIAVLEQALEIDPGFAAAWAQLAVTQSWAADNAEGPAELAEWQRKALASADKAVELDPGLADGYWARGNLRASVTWDWEGAQTDFRKALALNPGDARILQGYGSLLASLGRLPEAISTMQQATEAEPLLFSVWQALGYFQEAAGDLAAARQSQERALALKPKFPFVHFRLGTLALQQRQPKQAAAAFEASGYEPLQLLGRALAEHELRHGAQSQEALQALIQGYGHNAAYQIAQAYAWRGQRDEAFQWLERAFTQRDGGLAELKYDPLMRGLRKDPRWPALLNRVGLPP